jgi:hypothetical protein
MENSPEYAEIYSSQLVEDITLTNGDQAETAGATPDAQN